MSPKSNRSRRSRAPGSKERSRRDRGGQGGRAGAAARNPDSRAGQSPTGVPLTGSLGGAFLRRGAAALARRGEPGSVALTLRRGGATRRPATTGRESRGRIDRQSPAPRLLPHSRTSSTTRYAILYSSSLRAARASGRAYVSSHTECRGGRSSRRVPLCC